MASADAVELVAMADTGDEGIREQLRANELISIIPSLGRDALLPRRTG
jgi:hypothetical protein